MGIDRSAAIYVGLPYNEINLVGLDELIHEGDLDKCPQYFDSCREDDIVGLEYQQTWSNVELVYDQQKIDELKEKFKAITGQDAKVFLTRYEF